MWVAPAMSKEKPFSASFASSTGPGQDKSQSAITDIIIACEVTIEIEATVSPSGDIVICIIIFYIRIQINYMKKLFLAVLMLVNNNNSTILIITPLFLLLCLYYSFHKFVNQPDVFVLYRYVPSSGLFMLCAYLKTDVIIYYRWNVSLSLF